jgi:hypothetical protein
MTAALSEEARFYLQVVLPTQFMFMQCCQPNAMFFAHSASWLSGMMLQVAPHLLAVTASLSEGLSHRTHAISDWHACTAAPYPEGHSNG